jgi:hypothetical protein
VIGTISRLAPTQAHLQIQISNNRPVPESNEEFTGVIRLADIRLTERDKIKMGECFRLGDLVKARVVSFFSSLSPACLPSLPSSFAGRIIPSLWARVSGVAGSERHLASASWPFHRRHLITPTPFVLWLIPAISRRRQKLLPLNSSQRARCNLGAIR